MELKKIALTKAFELLNKALHPFRLRLLRIRRENKIPKEFVVNFYKNLTQLKKLKGQNVFMDFRYDAGVHPRDAEDYEYEFVARHLRKAVRRNFKHSPKMLDIGSHRQFILGLLASYYVATVDVRKRKSGLDNEIIITCDAKNLNLPSNEFDIVTSVCSLEHFGLGRYGDEFDLEADKKAFKEMVRVLKPGGYLIFTTSITRAEPSIGFNAGRIYSYEMIEQFCAGLKRIEENFYSHEIKSFCSFKEITDKPKTWDFYYGCWQK